MTAITSLFWGLVFWGFVAVKLVGVSFATWSWWWLLVPIVPWLGLIAQRWAL